MLRSRQRLEEEFLGRIYIAHFILGGLLRWTAHMVVLKAYFKLPVPGIKPRFPAHRALVSLASFCLALPMLLCSGACVGPT